RPARPPLPLRHALSHRSCSPGGLRHPEGWGRSPGRRMTMGKLTHVTPTRRDFMKAAGVLVVAISIPAYVRPIQAAAAPTAGSAPFGPLHVPAGDIASWLAIATDYAAPAFTPTNEQSTEAVTASTRIEDDASEMDHAR